MSAISGIVGRVDDRSARVEQMTAAQAHRGPHASAHEAFDHGMFGHAALYNSPESVAEQQPFTHEESGCIITADIRLDNRDRLIASLGVSRPEVGDAELALLAYLRWGSAAPRRLLGAFAIAIWNPAQGELLLCRDHVGVRPIIYAETVDAIVFASTVGAVRDGSPRRHPPSTEKVQHYLVDPLEAAQPDTTVLRGIFRVPRASTLTWRHGQATDITPYWRLEQPDRLRLRRDHDYLDAFTETFDRAVASRMRRASPRLASMLSGGLDSSAVVWSAHRQLTHKSDLTTYSGVESRPFERSDTPHIHAVVRALGLRSVEVTELDVITGYDLDCILSEPDSLFGGHLALLHVLLARVGAEGPGVLLSGAIGDELVNESAPGAARHALRQGRVIKAWRELGLDDARSVGARWMARLAAGLVTPRRVRGIARMRRAKQNFAESLEYAGISCDSPSAPRLWHAYRALLLDPGWNTSNHRVDAVWAPYNVVGFERYDRIGARYGVEVRSPFLDLRLIEFCLSLPPDQLRRAGWSKWILRQAIAAALPPSVVWRAKADDALAPFADAVARHQTETARQRDGQPEWMASLPGVAGALSPAHADDGHPERIVARRWSATHRLTRPSR